MGGYYGGTAKLPNVKYTDFTDTELLHNKRTLTAACQLTILSRDAEYFCALSILSVLMALTRQTHMSLALAAFSRITSITVGC